MAGIFINYRRDDAAGFARSLYEHLDQQFKQGQVFMDVEALREPGMDFVKEIERSLSRCAVMLVLIGKSWHSSTDAAGRRRIEQPDDFVRLEIATALRREIRVMPVLLNGATMPPTEQLPEDLQLLGRRQAIALTHDDWAHDVSRLVESIGKVAGIRKRSTRSRTGWSTRSLIVAGTTGAAIGLGLLAWAGFKFEDRHAAQQMEAAAFPQPSQEETSPAEEQSAPATESGTPPANEYATAKQEFAPVAAPATSDESDAEAAQANVAEQPVAYDDASAYDASATDTAAVLQAIAAMANAVDITGVWYDDNGIAAQLEQSGDAVTVTALNPATGFPQVIGSGNVQGRSVTINYRNFAGVPGTVQAELSPDGNHLNGTDTNALLNVPVPNTWHREHLPGD
jgi:hypothetical protein